jgi:Mrp family chromosome partitioning ATPase
MIQLFGQSGTSVADGGDGPAPSVGVRAFATPANADRAWFHLDLRRSLGMHWRLAWAIALTGGALAVLYFMGEAMVPKPWPAYKSESIVDVRPTPATILPNPGGSQRLPFDSNTFESYIQQQMTNVSRNDVLIAALHRLTGFQREGESDQAAAERLASRLEVTREGSAYRFSIGARAESPAMAAQIANAVTAAYIESPTRDVPTGDAQRVQTWKEERDRIQRALAADRTEQDALNRRLQKLGEAATSATGETQRLSELTAEIARLQARYAVIDGQLHDPKLEDGAPAAAYQVTPAAPPPDLIRSDVLRNALSIAVAGLFLAVLAAVCVHKLDPRVYIGADVERVLGFAPLAQLPDFNEVSDGAAEEYTLRLAAAIEQGRKQDKLKNCIFTGTGSETGVSTLVNRVAATLEAMGRPTVLVDASGARAPAPRGRDGGQALAPAERLSSPAALPQKADETETGEDSLVVTDTAPLAVSAETEYLARFADCAIVVIESGVTTRAELREAARTLERLKVATVGFVLNRVELKKADAAFRKSVEGVERHLRIYGRPAAIRNERQSSFAPDRRADREALSLAASAGSLFEPEVAAASVARFPAPAAAKLAETLAACLTAPMVSALVAEAAMRLSSPLTASVAAETAHAVGQAPVGELAASSTPAKDSGQTRETAKAGSSPVIAEPTASVEAEKIPWPIAEGATHLSWSVAGDAGVSALPRPAAPTAAASPLPIAQEEPSDRAAAAAPPTEPEAAEEPEAEKAATKPEPDVPLWLMESIRNREPVCPPAPGQLEKLWTAGRPSTDEVIQVAAQSLNVDPLKFKQAFEQWRDRLPSLKETPRAAPAPRSKEAPKSDLEEANGNLDSRLSALRNLLSVLGGKDGQGGEEPNGHRNGGGASFESRSEWTIREDGASSASGASPRMGTAPGEFIFPKPPAAEFEEGESSTRQGRRAAADGVEILPSKLGQYERL